MNKSEKIFDGLLVLQCNAGDKKALGLLVKRWHSKLCNQAFWFVKDTDIAKDVVQESWTVIMKKIKTIQEPNDFGSWASKIVLRKSIDYLRKSKKEDFKLKQFQEIQLDSFTIEHSEYIDYSTISNTFTTSEMVMNCIYDLPEQQQVVVRLFYIQEYSLKEIADILSISKGTVKSRLYYAREKLKLIIKNRNYEK